MRTQRAVEVLGAAGPARQFPAGRPRDRAGRQESNIHVGQPISVSHRSADRLAETIDLSSSLGLKLCNDGALTEVIWDGAGFNAALTVGSKLRAVNGKPYSNKAMADAVIANL